MKNGLIIADSGPIISLALVNQLALLESLFDDVKISQAVWNELTLDDTKPFYERICAFFKDKVHQI